MKALAILVRHGGYLTARSSPRCPLLVDRYRVTLRDRTAAPGVERVRTHVLFFLHPVDYGLPSVQRLFGTSRRQRCHPSCYDEQWTNETPQTRRCEYAVWCHGTFLVSALQNGVRQTAGRRVDRGLVCFPCCWNLTRSSNVWWIHCTNSLH